MEYVAGAGGRLGNVAPSSAAARRRQLPRLPGVRSGRSGRRLGDEHRHERDPDLPHFGRVSVPISRQLPMARQGPHGKGPERDGRVTTGPVGSARLRFGSLAVLDA